MIQILQDSQWRWLNRWKNRAFSGVDALDMEMECSGRTRERTPAINRILFLPGGHLVEIESGIGESSGHRHNGRSSSPPDSLAP